MQFFENNEYLPIKNFSILKKLAFLSLILEIVGSLKIFN